MIQITRRLEFDAGHRIPDHAHQCRHLHGHRYVLEVSVSGEVKNRKGASDNGMIADFGAIKTLVKQHLIDLWDHAFLVWKEDRAVVDFLQSLPNHKTVVFENVPTVENLTHQAWQILQPVFEEKGLKINRLKIFETPNNWAEFFPR